jgi:hypothetical protein
LVLSRNRNYQETWQNSATALSCFLGKGGEVGQVLGWRQERVQDGYTHFDIEHFQELRLE